MRKSDLAYMAGLFDGEGCILITRKSYNHHQYYLRCTLSMANEYLPELLKFNFGGGIRKRDLRTKGWQIQWEWKVFGNQAKDFLQVILPYIKLKHSEAELGIKFQKSMCSRKGVGRALTADELATREAQRLLMSELKMKQ